MGTHLQRRFREEGQKGRIYGIGRGDSHEDFKASVSVVGGERWRDGDGEMSNRTCRAKEG